MMITTTAAGRTWHYSHSMGRATPEHNESKWGTTGGMMFPSALAVSPDDYIFLLSRGNGYGTFSTDKPDIYNRIGKTTIDENHIGDFARGELTWPAGIAVASDGNVYCSDEFTNKIRYYDPDATVPFPDYNPDGESLGSWGETGSAQGKLSGPNGIVFDRQDNLYVVDSRNDRIQKFTKGGEFLSCWGGPGDGDGQFKRPSGITINTEGDVYVADWGNNRVQKFSPDGTYLMSFGTDPQGGGDLDHPCDVAVDSDGDVYVTDWGNRRVQIFEADGEPLTALYGDAIEPSKAGHYLFNRDVNNTRKVNNRAEDVLPKVSQFRRPVAITIYKGHQVIISDSQCRLVVYIKDSNYEEPIF